MILLKDKFMSLFIQKKKQQGSLLAQRTKPRRRVVGSKRKKGYGGTNTRRPR